MIDALVSYHYLRSDDHMRRLVDSGRLNMIGDSGAYSAYTQGVKIGLEEYAGWVRRWQPDLAWCASLDVLGDPQGTWRNWQALRDAGLATVPTLHVGTPERWLHVYGEQGVDFVGLGGGLTTGDTAGIRWAARLLAHGRRHLPAMRFHGWGISSRAVLDNLPLYSADSSGTLGVGYRFGQLRLFDPRTARDTTFYLDGCSALRHRRLLERFYGTSPEQVLHGDASNRPLLIRLMARSTTLYAAWLRKRHQVTPPAYGLDPQRRGQGTRLHLVDTQVRTLLTAAQADTEPEGMTA
ncbi:hypothetical protein C1I98_20320 [Spongiactinospora gelatinilytica]|uniref:Queuine tRNA-ribosyltransferase n=1 Tax=Spongiactinospora gelatinilytica TaxID=2666298 RepID=A0A2W2HTJ7_9ACTN|nr:hypothetical protein [Spongiactinospora gelatinilytica]PZG42014.1 hypothetical protein C1I98_20320 [Spongiactinospora gelatinilytica]